jgi:hypothetical protein
VCFFNVHIIFRSIEMHDAFQVYSGQFWSRENTLRRQSLRQRWSLE